MKDHLSVALVFALAILGLGVSPAAAAPRNQACVLSKPLTITAKPKAQGRKIKLNAGASVEVLSHANGWVQLRSAGQEGYAQVQPLRRSCRAGAGSEGDTLADLPIEPIVAGNATASAATELPLDTSATNEAAQPAALPPMNTAAKTAPATAPAKVAAASTSAGPSVAASARAAEVPVGITGSSTSSAPSSLVGNASQPDSVELTLTPPMSNQRIIYSATLWTAAGIGLLGAGGMYGYNTVRANALEHDINNYNKLSARDQTSATALQQRVSQVRALDTWTLIAAGAGAACAAGAIYFTWFASNDDGTSSDGSIASGEVKHQVGINVLPGGISIFGNF